MTIKSLVVDDFPINRLVLHKYLTVLGRVHDAENGLSGIELFEQALRGKKGYDLVCLDISMPGMNGFEVLARMRELEEEYSFEGMKKTVILMVSAHSDKDNIMMAIAKSDGFVVKPITQQVLYAKLKALGFECPDVVQSKTDVYEKKPQQPNRQLIDEARKQLALDEKKPIQPTPSEAPHDDLLNQAADAVLRMDIPKHDIEESELVPPALATLKYVDGTLVLYPIDKADAVISHAIGVKKGHWIARLDTELRSCSLGDGLETDATGNALRAKTNGQLVLQENTLYVETRMKITEGACPHHVDFAGDVNIAGDVLGGQSIRAGQDVKISGIMGQSTIHSGGNVEIYRLHGAEKGEIHADGHVKAAAVYNAVIESKQDVTIDKDCIGSKILSLGNIVADTVTGGKCVAQGSISVRRAGAELDVTTILMAGVDYRVEERMGDFRLALKHAQEEIRRLEQLVGPKLAQITDKSATNVLLSERQQLFVTQLLKARRVLEEIQLDAAESERQMAVSTTATIDVEECLHQGVVVQLGAVRNVVSRLMKGKIHIHYDAKAGQILFDKMPLVQKGWGQNVRNKT